PFMLEASSYEETPFFTRVVFNNGLTVLVDEYRAHPVVSIQAHIRTEISGSFQRNIQLAHLTAAMIGRGGEKLSAGTVRQNVQAMGGIFRTAVLVPDTLFEIVVPSDQWKQALDLHASALLHPHFSADDLKQEASLLQHEARTNLALPAVAAAEHLLELGFNRPAAGAVRITAADSIHDHTIETLKAFHDEHYTPAKITLVVSGDVRSADILNRVTQAYDKGARKKAPQVRAYRETPRKGFRYAAVRAGDSGARLLFGFHAPAENDDDYRALEVIGAMLGMGEGSILAAHLKRQKGLAYAVRTGMRTFMNSGFLFIEVETAAGSVDLAAIAVLAELELLKRGIMSDADLERAYSQLELAHWKRLESVTGRAETIARHEASGGWKRINNYVAEGRKVTPADIRRVATSYLKLQNCFFLELLPDSAPERKTTTEIVRRTFESLLEPAVKEELERRAKLVIPAIDIPEYVEKFRRSEVRNPFITASILRGPDMFIRRDHISPLVDVGIFFRGGTINENRDNAGITWFMTHLMLRGAGAAGGDDWNRQLELYGGTVEPVVTRDYFGVYLSILSRNMDAGLQMILHALKDPAFSGGDFDRQKQLQRAEIAGRGRSNRFYEQTVMEVLFGDFPYAL
ncbi:MAG TPA: insulinase family protein, partial [Acidobacteriota bacterium]|nr:insulinase family protein [Acidobacteriota bacterium]